MPLHKISKVKVKEAIINEPLQARKFFHVIDELGKCSVCAVGAVLRNNAIISIHESTLNSEV